MFGGVNVWQIAEAKEIGEIKFGELIDFIHRDAIYMLNIGWLKFGEPWTAPKLSRCQTFPLYGNYFLSFFHDVTWCWVFNNSYGCYWVVLCL